MSKFLWYSNSSSDTGTWLAAQLGLGSSHGVVPPAKFSGTLICWGAAPAEKFKWGNRNIRALLNDPRKTREFSDRKVLFAKLTAAGVSTITCVPMTEEAQYTNICGLLGITVATGFVACKPSGSNSRLITTQEQLNVALSEGCSRALEPRFAATQRRRVFVVDKKAVGMISKTPTLDNAGFIQQAADAAVENWAEKPAKLSKASVQKILGRVLTLELVQPKQGLANKWSAHTTIPATLSNKAVVVANTLGYEFCAVDFQQNSDAVLNVVITPALVEAKELVATVVSALAAWLNKNSMTAKEALLAIINNATADEADSLLDGLRSLKDSGNKASAV